MCCRDGNGPHGRGGRRGQGNGRGIGAGCGCGKGRGRGMGGEALDAIVTGACAERIRARIASLQARLADMAKETVQA